MRDDIEILACDLLYHYKQKLAFLKEIHSSEINKRYHLKTGDIEFLSDLLDKDSDVIDVINNVDVDIMNTKHRICRTIGIDEDSFDSAFKDSDAAIVGKIREIEKEIQVMLNTLYLEREKLMREMEKERGKIKSDITSLKFIGKTRIKPDNF